MNKPELSGVAIVCAGAFNPAIVHPSWLADKDLISKDLAKYVLEQKDGQQVLVSSQVTTFVADWLSVQIVPQQAVLSTADLGRALDLRDLASGLLNLLPETPVDGLGINADAHYRVSDAATWHAFGDKVLPKDLWEMWLDGHDWKARSDGKKVGLRTMTVELTRSDSQVPGFVRVEVAPSVRVTPYGVYVGLNAHFDLTTPERRANAADAARVLAAQWDGSRQLASDIQSKLAKAI